MKTLPISYYRGRLWATMLPDPCQNEALATGFALDKQYPNYAKFSLQSAKQVGRINEETLNLLWSEYEQASRQVTKNH